MNKIFEKGGKLHWLHSTVDAFETFLRVPGTVTRKGSHVRDAIDLKRILIIVLIAAAPAALFGMWNVGYQHSLAIGDTGLNILGNFWYGFLKVLPLYIVSYVVGLGIEFAACQIRGEEVSEGFLVSGFFIPLIVPVDIPLWMLAIAVAFAVIFGKEVFGGTGMNIWNPALLTRAFLFFSYPSYMSGSECWISFRKTDTLVDGFTGATPLALDGAPAQYGTGFWDLFIGTVPGSVGETSVIAILIGAVILIWTGVGHRSPCGRIHRRHRRNQQVPLLHAAPLRRIRLRSSIHGDGSRHLCPDRMRQVDLRYPDRCALPHGKAVQPRIRRGNDARNPAGEHLRTAHRPSRDQLTPFTQGQET